MMITKIGVMPDNYKKIDNTLSRSAQINVNNIKWLKDNNVTDIINFRTMHSPAINFNEKEIVENFGLKYHNIPSVSLYPNKENVGKFLDIVNNIKQNGGKAHIHCKHGADRTGMYSYIYERLNNIQTPFDNYRELVKHGWHIQKYPSLAIWAENLVLRLLKK